MSSRRFDDDDSIDEDRKDSRTIHTIMMILFTVIGAVVAGISAVFSGKSLHAYEVDMGGLLAFMLVGWFVFPIYEEHRNRQKEIYGMVTEIGKTISAVKEGHKDLLESLTGISKRLAAFENGLNPGHHTEELDTDIEDEPREDSDVDAKEIAVKIAKYREAAERGEAWAQRNLGVTYYNGDRGARDSAQAAFWFRKAAEQGDEFSQFLLAGTLCEREGDGLPDYSEAMLWYRKVSDQDSMWSSHAEYQIAQIYMSGKGVAKDGFEAVKWWGKAAERGYALANYNLGELFADGAEGVPQDHAEAYFRLYAAAGGEGLHSLQEYAVKKRNEVAAKLDSAALSKAQERAEQWLAAHPAKH